MNANTVTAKFQLLLHYEKEMNYKYEPRFKKEGKGWKRHINFKDFKEDFIEDLSTFGFSPFILKTSKEQWKDPNIMKYKPRNFNSGLINYVKRKQEGIESNQPCLSHTPKKLNPASSKENLFLSNALKQLSRQRAQDRLEEDKEQTNEGSIKSISSQQKEPFKTSITNFTENGVNGQVRRRSIVFKKGVNPDTKRILEEAKHNVKSFHMSDIKKRVLNGNAPLIVDKLNLAKRFAKQAMILKNQKIRKSLSQMKSVKAISCLSNEKTSSNIRDMARTRNRKGLSPNHLLSRAKILCRINLSS